MATTASAHVAVFEPAFAVITAAPALIPFTVPDELTVATEVLFELQVTVLSVAFSGMTVATKFKVSPSRINKE